MENLFWKKEKIFSKTWLQNKIIHLAFKAPERSDALNTIYELNDLKLENMVAGNVLTNL